MYAFGVHTFLGGVCACFFFELNSKKTCPNLAWLCFFLRFLFTQKWSCNPRPTFEFTQSHPRPDRPTYSKYSKTPCHFLPLGRGRNPRSWGRTKDPSKQGGNAEMLQRPLEITKGIRNPIQQTGMGRFRTAVNDLRPHNTYLEFPQFAKKNGITVFSR